MIHVRRRRYTTCTKYTYVYNALLYVYGRVTYGTRTRSTFVFYLFSKIQVVQLYVHVYNVVRVLPEYLRTKVDIILSTRVQLREHVLYTCTRSDIFYLQDTVSCYSISVIRKYESTSVLPYCTRTVLPSLRKTFIGNFLAA